ncbi:MAG: hypothetical protein JWO12_2247 [Frankiales bacterium]|nr:hypothetical protein [Frankiales bacterium]
MTTWVLPEQTWTFDGAQDGDVLLRHEGEVVVVGRATNGAVEWLGPVAEGALDVGAVTEPTERPDLDAAVEPIAAAAGELGG